jgi:PAS domain S-box-containing protein
MLDPIYLRGFLRRILQLGIASTVSGTSLWMSVRFGVGVESGVFPFLFPASVVGAWTGGLAGGALATAVLALGAAYYHLPPAGLAVGNSFHALALFAFIVSGLLIAWVVDLLQHSRDLIKSTLLSVGDGVIAINLRNQIQVMNPLAEALTGWRKEDALGKPLGKVLRALATSTDPDPEKLAMLAIREGRVVGLPEDAFLMPKSGHACPIDDAVAPIRSRMGKVVGVVIVFRDATRRRRTEAALIEAEARYREIFENAVVGMFQCTPDGRYLRVNQAMAKMYGYDSAQAMTDAANDPASEAQADTTLREAFKRVANEEGIMSAVPLEVLRRDGTRFSTIVNARVVRDADGAPLYYEGTQEDVTDRKRLQAQFEHAQRMEAVGRLAGGVAHDFNNVLSIIVGYSDIAQRNAESQRPILKEIAQIKNAAERASRLTMQLLAFGRQQVIQPDVLNLSRVASDMSAMLERLVGEDISISLKLSDDLGLILADRVQIEQILLNLAVNARDAMPQGGRINIETMNVILDKEYVKQHPPSTSGPFVMVAFSDTGHGIDKTLLPKIFEPFFTTQEPGKGSGLGLATVYGIVKQNNGNIWVYSEPGLGTTFKIYFPKVDLSETLTVAESQHTSQHGTETILLVEDDLDIREVACTILTAAGYNVIRAENTTAAIEAARSTFQRIDLLLTDIIMPGMSGVELRDRVRALRPDIKALYMTGYAGQELSRRGLLKSDAPVVQKPFDAYTLLANVRTVLDRESS